MRPIPAAAALMLAALSPATADTLSDRGYAVGCDAEGAPLFCYVVASGMVFEVAQDGGTPPAIFDTLLGFPDVTAVAFTGRMGDPGDVTAPLVIDTLDLRPDDPHEGNLRALQGLWKPRDEGSPFHIEIAGLDWLEFEMDELRDAFLIAPGHACGDATLQGGGTVLALYRYGDDPAQDACWQVDFVDATRLDLRDASGDRGSVTFDRLPD